MSEHNFSRRALLRSLAAVAALPARLMAQAGADPTSSIRTTIPAAPGCSPISTPSSAESPL